MNMLLFCIVIGIISFIIFVKWRQLLWKRLKVPYVEPEFIFGNMRNVFNGKKTLGELSLDIYRESKSLGRKHVGYYRLLNPAYVPLDLSLIKNILQKDFHHFSGHSSYYHPKDVLSMNLFNLEGEYWRKIRVKLTPTFTSTKMKLMFETLMQKVTILENYIGKAVDRQEPLPVKEILANFTIDVIGSCGFGIECNCFEDSNNAFKRYGTSVFKKHVLNVMLKLLLPRWLLANIGFKAHGRDVNDFISNLVKETVEYRESNKIYRKDFLNLLLEIKNDGKGDNTLSMDEIIAQCFVFFAAGFETSSTAMTFALLQLAQNQEIQDKLRQEINAVIEKHNGEITYDTVMDMTYLDKVVSETLRMFPPLPVLPRVCTKRYKVPGTDLVLEKGTLVDIFVLGIHKDPEYYPEPEIFDPERFSKENVAKRPDCTYMPFGEGPRLCIGLRFGLLQTKVGLLSLIRKFNFTMNSKTKLPIELEGSALVHTVKSDVWLNATRV